MTSQTADAGDDLVVEPEVSPEDADLSPDQVQELDSSDMLVENTAIDDTVSELYDPVRNYTGSANSSIFYFFVCLCVIM